MFTLSLFALVWFKNITIFEKKNALYYNTDINLSNIPNYLSQPKVNKTFLSDVNVVDFVAPDKPIPIMVETIDCDNSKGSGSNKEEI